MLTARHCYHYGHELPSMLCLSSNSNRHLFFVIWSNINFAISAGCTYKWATYVGFHSIGLVQLGSTNQYTQIQCQAACIDEPSCNCVDFDEKLQNLLAWCRSYPAQSHKCRGHPFWPEKGLWYVLRLINSNLCLVKLIFVRYADAAYCNIKYRCSN